MKALVLFSGGLDSTTCLALAVSKFGAENVMALSMQYGQKHDKETKCAYALAKYYNVELKHYDLTSIFESSDCSLLKGSSEEVPEESYNEQLRKRNGNPVTTYVPFRNGLFISVAASLALSYKCDFVYCGIHRDDAAGSAYPDCSVDFTRAMRSAIMQGTGGKVDLAAPFFDMTKADIVAIGTTLHVPYEMTWSCYNGGDKPCGKCATCIDRINAFKINELEDPLEYDEVR